MKFCTLITTRSKSCSVKTLHTILRMNIRCIQYSHQNEILYVNDDPFEKVDMIMQCLKKCDRLLFIDFGVNVDDGSIKQIFEPLENTSVLTSNRISNNNASGVNGPNPLPKKTTAPLTIKCHKTTLNTEVPSSVCMLSLCKSRDKSPVRSIVPYTNSISGPYRPIIRSVVNNNVTGSASCNKRLLVIYGIKTAIAINGVIFAGKSINLARAMQPNNNPALFINSFMLVFM